MWNAASVNPSCCIKQAQVLLGEVIKSSSLAVVIVAQTPLVSSNYVCVLFLFCFFQMNTFCMFSDTISNSKLIWDWIEMSRSEELKYGTFLTNNKEICSILNVFFFFYRICLQVTSNNVKLWDLEPFNRLELFHFSFVLHVDKNSWLCYEYETEDLGSTLIHRDNKPSVPACDY